MKILAYTMMLICGLNALLILMVISVTGHAIQGRIFEPVAMTAQSYCGFKHEIRGAASSSIVHALGRRERQALRSMPVATQISCETSAAPPRTFNDFLAQNAAQEKNSEAIQTLGVLAIMLLTALALVGRWLLRR